MDDEEISYKHLRRIQQLEKNSPTLAHIKSDFYKELSSFVTDMEERLNNESSAQKKVLLKEELENIKKIAENIYEQREKKIVLAAVSKVRGGNPDLNNMSSSEKRLFDAVVSTMLESRSQVFTECKSNDDEVEEVVETEKNEEEDNPPMSNSNSIVRITKNVPEFIGTDEKRYNLRKNDLISLPKCMSDTLEKREVAETIEHLA